MQIDHRHDPWKMLVGCIMLNQTTYVQARPVVDSLLELCKSPTELIRFYTHHKEQMVDMLKPCGLQNRRADSLWKFSTAWSLGERDLHKLPGIGQYARDSYAIFIEERTDVDPTDKELRKFLRWASDASSSEVRSQGPEAGSGS